MGRVSHTILATTYFRQVRLNMSRMQRVKCADQVHHEVAPWLEAGGEAGEDQHSDLEAMAVSRVATVNVMQQGLTWWSTRPESSISLSLSISAVVPATEWLWSADRNGRALHLLRVEGLC